MILHRLSRTGFSLVEIIAAICVIALLSALALPAIAPILKSTQLSQSHAFTVGELGLARQTALSRNRFVEVRFYLSERSPGNLACRSFQTWLVNEDGSLRPLGKVVKWPKGIVFGANADSSDCDVSSLVPRGSYGLPIRTASAGDPPSPDDGSSSYRYMTFRFAPEGGTTLVPPRGSADNTNRKLWYFSLYNESEAKSANGLPANYLTVQIDPFTGQVSASRP